MEMEKRQPTFEDNVKLVTYMANKIYKRQENPERFDFEEMLQEGNIGLWKAVRTFKTDKGFRFSTYASHCIQNQIYQYMKKESKYRYYSGSSLDDPIPSAEDVTFQDMVWSKRYSVEGIVLGKELGQYYEDPETKKSYIRRSPEFERREQLVYQMMLQGFKQKEIAKILGVSQRMGANHYEIIRSRIKREWQTG